MKLSARNQLKGKIIDQTTAHVRVEIRQGRDRNRVDHQRAVDELQLKAGDDVTAIV